MHIKYKLLLIIVYAVEICSCQSEVNVTLNSRREILEKQALRAYQNACFGMQELANWMSVVFKIKSVWTSSTISQIAANSAGTDTGQRTLPSLPSRPKAQVSECSLRSVQVTLRTYAHLQQQLLHLKTIVSRNAVKAGKEKLVDANESLRQRRVLDVFNVTLNDILLKLKENTQELSTQVNTGNWSAWNVIQDIQEGRLLRYLQDPKNIFQNTQTRNEDGEPPTKSRNVFQNVGKALDRIMFP